MYYISYLESLCKRRKWSDPLYRIYPTASGGYAAAVNVQAYEYTTEKSYPTRELAREAAAMRAYLICRNISAIEQQLPQFVSVGSGGGNGWGSV